jgi:hypothetical protein
MRLIKYLIALALISIIYKSKAEEKAVLSCIYNYTEKINIHILSPTGVAVSKKSIKNNLIYVFYIKNIKKPEFDSDYVKISDGKYKIIYPLRCE